jgi:predicted nucleotidyltransferase
MDTADLARLESVLLDGAGALEAADVPYVLIGGAASSIRGRPRISDDVDFLVRKADAERALDVLGAAGFETERTDPQWIYKAMRDRITIDLMFWLAGDMYCDDDVLAHATRERYGGGEVNVASAEDLIVIKLLAHDEPSPHHWHDALALLALSEIDWDYLLERGRLSPRRLLSLLIYAESVDLAVSEQAIRKLFDLLYGEAV